MKAERVFSKGGRLIGPDNRKKEDGKSKDETFNGRGRLLMVRRGHPGRGGRGSCGGTRRRDGSGRGRGNRGTARQPKR